MISWKSPITINAPVRPEGYPPFCFADCQYEGATDLLYRSARHGVGCADLMHGVKGAWHNFLRFNGRSFLSFFYIPKMESVESVLGVSHSSNSAGGTMRHLSLRIQDHATVLAMRDRVCSHGVSVLGERHDNTCRSIYSPARKDLVLEVASHGEMERGAWMDPDIMALAGIGI